MVEKVITLYSKRFEQMRDHPLEDAPEIIKNRKLMYMEGGTAHCILFLDGNGSDGIPTTGKSDSDTVQNHIYTSVTSENCVKLPFYWFYCNTFITRLTPCDATTPGEYYLCWVGRSNNSHPVVREMKVMN